MWHENFMNLKNQSAFVLTVSLHCLQKETYSAIFLIWVKEMSTMCYEFVIRAKWTCLSKKWEDERQHDSIQIEYKNMIKLSLWNQGVHNSADSNIVWHFSHLLRESVKK